MLNHENNQLARFARSADESIRRAALRYSKELRNRDFPNSKKSNKSIYVDPYIAESCEADSSEENKCAKKSYPAGSARAGREAKKADFNDRPPSGHSGASEGSNHTWTHPEVLSALESNARALVAAMREFGDREGWIDLEKLVEAVNLGKFSLK